MLESDKIMFQVYREAGYNRKYRVVYFTELHDHNRETEINRAVAGKTFFEGFIRNFKKDQAKQIIENAIQKLNDGEMVDPEDLARDLGPFMPVFEDAKESA
jgi:hypothetical protein